MLVCQFLMFATLSIILVNAQDPALPDDICIEGIRTIPHPNDCAKYIKCDTTEYVVESVLTCPSPLLFDQVFKGCSDPFTVICKVGPQISTPSPEVQSDAAGYKLGCRLDGDVIIPYPKDCSKYVICDFDHDKSVVVKCPSGFVFDNTTKGCGDINTVKCVVNTVSALTMSDAEASDCIKLGTDKFVSSKTSCRDYISCKDSSKISCQDGYRFDQDKQLCVQDLRCGSCDLKAKLISILFSIGLLFSILF